MFVCLNCNFRFERGSFCPRCNSRKLKQLEFKEPVKATAGVAGSVGAPGTVASTETKPVDNKPLVFDKSGQRVYGDSKEAWKSFHKQVQVACPKCGGVKFHYDMRHKEKTCANCGEILFMPRRPV